MSEPTDDPLTEDERAQLALHDGPTIGPAPADVAAASTLDSEVPSANGRPAIGEGLAPWSEMLLPLLQQLSAVLERVRPRWAMSTVEQCGLAVAWGAVLDSYKIKPAGLEVTALALTFGYAVPRILADQDERRNAPEASLDESLEYADSEGRAVICDKCGEGFDGDAAYMDHLCPVPEQ